MKGLFIISRHIQSGIVHVVCGEEVVVISGDHNNCCFANFGYILNCYSGDKE